MFFQDDTTMGYTWNGNPFEYIDYIRSQYNDWIVQPAVTPTNTGNINQLTAIGNAAASGTRYGASPTTTANQQPQAQQPGIFDQFSTWAANPANQTTLLLGAAVVVVLLTRGKK